MRNLHLTQSEVVAFNQSDIGNAKYISLDPDSNIVYIAADGLLSALDCATKQVVKSISLPPQDASLASTTPVGLQYLFDNQAVCVATQDGQLFLWSANSDELECVGVVEHGLVAMSWSPGSEIFILITSKDTMILMTSEFDPFTEVSIFPDHSGEESPISVGWGKKETQFHGSAGKEAAKVQAVVLEPVGPNDPGHPFVCWRGDGSFFVISAVDPMTGARSLYTWSRECVFQSKSEPVKGLQHGLFWKPSGSLIASVQHKGEGMPQDVIFFEKNGLRHGEFSIPKSVDKDTLVHRLMWNTDSTILLLWINRLSPQNPNEGSSEVQLWTSNNYHWYQKQCLKFNGFLSTVEWDPMGPNTLHVLTKGGHYIKYTWSFAINRTSGRKPDDLASVGVIDGIQVLVTPMRQTVVPPPMSAFALTLPEPASFVTFHPTSNDVAVITADDRVAVFSYEAPNEDEEVKRKATGGNGFACQVTIPTLKSTLSFPDTPSDFPLQKSHFLWIRDTKLLYVSYDVPTHTSVIHLADMDVNDGHLKASCALPLDGLVVAVAPNETQTQVAVQMVGGQVLRLDVESESIHPWETKEGRAVRLPLLCPHMAVGQMGDQEVVLSLTERHRFFADGVEISTACTSFALHNDFLLVTTITHVIHCISRSTKAHDLPKFFDGKERPLDERTRKAERGAQIVAVVADDTKLILQMPRGNLETISPRALVLKNFQNLMDSNQLLKAFQLIRRHRINVNLLYDHNPQKFMASIDEFIAQLQNINYFNLFITDLKEEDVTQTMYPASYDRHFAAGPPPSTTATTESKVDLVCDALLAAFKRLGEDRYLLPILTAHVKKTRPELEQALLLVWSLHGKQTKANQPSALEALKYLLFLVDVHSLYDAALATFNFDLVLMVAGQSHKDPKEYIPFLNNMRRLEENYMKYSINHHLKRYTSALEHISKCGNDHFDEAVTLITDHKLHLKALSLYKGDTVHYKQIASLYGAYLETKNRHDEAGIMYVKAGEWERALACFRAAHDWRQVFCMASRLDYGTNQVIELAKKMAEDMKNNYKHLDASRIYEDYAKDPEEAIAVLIEGSLWSEALRLMHRHKRLDLIETHLLDALKESAEKQMEFLKGQRELFDRHFQRLAVVRREKEKAYLNYLEGAGDGHDAEADLFSDTSSITGASVTSHRTFDSSRSTVFSKATGSSRSRRKVEGKKWSLKEGSANEEFALVEALAKEIRCVDGVREEMKQLMKALIEFGFDDKAGVLQTYYSEFLTAIQSSLDKIWITEQTQAVDNLGPGTTANAIIQAMQRGQAHTQTAEVARDPVLVTPPKLNKEFRWKLHIAGDLDK